jgi:hypothetical protein
MDLSKARHCPEQNQGKAELPRSFLFACVTLTVFIVHAHAHAQPKCKEGFHFDRMSGVGCVQTNCWTVDPPHSHFDYTGHCVCGTDDCKADPVCKECRDKNGLLVDCVTDLRLCPGAGVDASATVGTRASPPDKARSEAEAQNRANSITRGMSSSIGDSVRQALDALDAKVKEALERAFPGAKITETEWFFKDDESWGYFKFRGIADNGYEFEGKVGSFYFTTWPWTDGIKLQANLVELQDFSFGGGGVYIDWSGEHVSIDLDVPETSTSVKITPWDYYDRARRFLTEDVPEFVKSLDLLQNAMDYRKEQLENR